MVKNNGLAIDNLWFSFSGASPHKFTQAALLRIAARSLGGAGLSAQMRRRPALALQTWRTWLPTGRPAATAGLRRAGIASSIKYWKS